MNGVFNGIVYKKSANSHISVWESLLLRLGWILHFEESTIETQKNSTEQYTYNNQDPPIKIQN